VANSDRGVVGYTLSRFPKISETFILDELYAVERQRVRIDLCPLRRERTDFIHPRAESWLSRAHFIPLVSGRTIVSHLAMLARSPTRYVRALSEVIWGNRSSRRLLLGALATWPRAVPMAVHFERAEVKHLHCHFASHPALAGYIVHRLVGIPFSFTAHGSDLHRDQTMLRQKVAAAAFVVAISDTNRQLILEHCERTDAAKVHVVHCGVDLDRFRTRHRGRGAPRGPLRIICVGTLHAVKGQRYLIEAVARLRTQGLLAQLVLVGDGPDLRALEERAVALGTLEAVEFAGARTQPEVAEILASADVLATPSVPTPDGRREGIPVALMEGMACGLPVVASALAGIPELVRHGYNGLLVEPGDVEGLVDALKSLAHDPDLCARLGAAARQTIEAEFEINASAARLALLFLNDRPEEQPVGC
jgi:glycosyltransferase involved in cell wall biosynthesis